MTQKTQTGHQIKVLATATLKRNVVARRDTTKESQKYRKSESAAALLALSQQNDFKQSKGLENSDAACQTNMTVDETLEKENSALKEQLKEICLGEESFRNNDEKVLFYTGLPN